MPNSKKGKLKGKELKGTLRDEGEILKETKTLINETRKQRFTNGKLTASTITAGINQIDKSLADLDSLQTDVQMNSQQYREAALQKAQLKAQKARLKIAKAVKKNGVQEEKVAAAMNSANRTGKITDLKRLISRAVHNDNDTEE